MDKDTNKYLNNEIDKTANADDYHPIENILKEKIDRKGNIQYLCKWKTSRKT